MGMYLAVNIVVLALLVAIAAASLWIDREADKHDKV